MTKKAKIITTLITVIGLVIVGYFKYSGEIKKENIIDDHSNIITENTKKSVVIGKVDNNSNVKVEYVGRDKIDNSSHVEKVDKSTNVKNITTINAAKVFTDKEKKEILNELIARNISLNQPDIKCITLTPDGAFGGSSDLVKDLTLFLIKKGFIINKNTNTIIDGSSDKKCFIKDMPKGYCNWLIISDI